ncbi:MAG: HEPN domain-containing protein [Euryarchaeota archaeon]|nr:HEPN domain-containing protein [Euryarchaeota archaeon]
MKESIAEELALAEEKLGAAKYLLEGGYYRDAISRAYYSMYHSAKSLLAIKEIYPKSHRGTLMAFGLEVVKEKEIEDLYGKALRFAMEKREMSDYDFSARFSREEAEAVIEDAERFLERIKKAVGELE